MITNAFTEKKNVLDRFILIQVLGKEEQEHTKYGFWK